MQNKPRLTTQVSILQDSIQGVHTAFADELGITTVVLEVLDRLYLQDGQHASALARSIGRAPTSFTPILDKIERAGLICRKPDPADRRAILIFLTPEGGALKKRIVDHMEKSDADLKKALASRFGRPVDSTLLEALFAPLPEAHPF